MSKTISSVKKQQAVKTARMVLTAAVRYFFLLSLSYVVLYQMAYILSQSFKPQAQIYDPSVVWIPKSFTTANIKEAWNALEYPKRLLNSFLIPVCSGLLEVFTCSLAAYGLARFKFRENKLVFLLVMLTILVPSQMIMVPSYLNYSHLDILGIFGLLARVTGIDIRPNVLDTALTFYLPAMFGVGLRSGFFVFIYMQFFKKMPKELEEAAWIDGANPFKTFLKVIIPSSKVAITTVTIFSVIWHYNDYYLSAMYFSDRYPLAVSLSLIALNSSIAGTDYARILKMAGCLLFILPVLLMYMVLQRKFIQNIDQVGIVG